MKSDFIAIHCSSQCLCISPTVNMGLFYFWPTLQESFHYTNCGCIQQQSAGWDQSQALAQCHERLPECTPAGTRQYERCFQTVIFISFLLVVLWMFYVIQCMHLNRVPPVCVIYIYIFNVCVCISPAAPCHCTKAHGQLPSGCWRPEDGAYGGAAQCCSHSRWQKLVSPLGVSLLWKIRAFKYMPVLKLTFISVKGEWCSTFICEANRGFDTTIWGH